MKDNNNRAHFKRVHARYIAEDGEYAMRAPVYHSAPAKTERVQNNNDGYFQKDKAKQNQTLFNLALKALFEE